MSRDWHKHYLEKTEMFAADSKDRSTKLSALIVDDDHNLITTGYNGFPRGCNDDVEERHQRPLKYKFSEHAERNAIFNAARQGISIKGCTMYINHDLGICTDCARAIIQAGIIRVVGIADKPFPGKGEHWEEDLRIAREMLEEVGIELILI